MTAAERLEFCKIPFSKLTPQLIDSGLNSLNEILSWSNVPAETSYYDAAVKVVRDRGMFISQIHPGYIDANMLSSISVNAVATALNLKTIDGYSLITQTQINQALLLDINFCLEIKSEYVLDQVLKAAIQQHPKRKADSLINIGRLEVIQNLVSDGYWPHRESNVPDKKFLQTLDDTIKVRMKKNKDDRNECMWLNALIKTYPLHDVIPKMKTSARRRVLVEMYDRATLLQELKHDPVIMSMLLESEIGL